MSRHRIVHTFDANEIVSEFDGDDYDEEEDELSPEDRAAMTEGTAEVRRILGAAGNKVTTEQIQEALWHYYYDVDKSVIYLTKTFISPAPKPTPKKAPEGEWFAISYSAADSCFLRASGADQEQTEPGDMRRRCLELATDRAEFRISKKPRLCSPGEFNDMPWLNIPTHRQTTFIEPDRPKGGLLGGAGSGQMSKLQALAAARKKKMEDKKEQEKISHVQRGVKNLSIDNNTHKENQRPLSNKRQKVSESSALQPQDRDSQSPAPEDESLEKSTEQRLAEAKMEEVSEPSRDEKPTYLSYCEGEARMEPRAAPSAFAQALFGPPPDVRQNEQPDYFPMPYTFSPYFCPEAFDKPSPDEIVLAAQAKAGTGKKNAAAAKASKKAAKDKDTSKPDEVAKDVATLKIDEAPPPKSKGLDVIKEFEKSSNKRSISFVVVGHVDAGKSTLMGRLLLELKFVEKHTIDRYRKLAEKSGKQSFALAWVMDQRSEERERGVTIDIATNHFETSKTNFTILDAPGHRDFVPNMIAGASQADFAILVIDANTGAFERGLKGQTREHVLLLRSLGVQRLVIAVNKLDMVGWSKERFEEIQHQVSGFLVGLGFHSKNVSFIPMSGLNGDNLVKPTEDAAAGWYTGGTLIEALEDSEPSSARALKKPFRMTISEIFRSQQGAITIAGRVDSGSIQIGDVLLVQPSGEEAYIKSILVDMDMQDWAVAGQSVSVALSNIDPIHVRVGDMLCHKSAPINCADTFTMKAMAFEHLMPMPVDLHRGRLHAPGQIQSITATLDKASGSVIKKKPRIVQPGAVARVVVKLASKVPLESGQRVVIRSGGETIAAGLLE